MTTDSQLQLNTSCEDPMDFPKNIIRHNTYEHSLKAYHERLNEHEDRLFQSEENAAVDFSELAVQGKGTTAHPFVHSSNVRTRILPFPTVFWPTCTRNVRELREQLGVGSSPIVEGPCCRFV